MSSVTSQNPVLPSASPEWRRLVQLAADVQRSLELGNDLRHDTSRGPAACGIELDGRRIRLTSDALGELHALARSRGVENRRDSMFSGGIVNRSEQRPALHIALRAREPLHLNDAIAGQVLPARRRMREMAETLHAGAMKGSTGERVTDIVNIGIGGSDFGSRLLCGALRERAPLHLRVHFVSGVDAVQIKRLCLVLDPARTLFIVSSKSFSTVETLLNAKSLLQWFRGGPLRVEDHWFAVTGNPSAAEKLGIPRTNVLNVPEWVGGRFSAWGAVGLPAALYVGWPTYREWLDGGAEMDEHHASVALEDNLPVRLALHNVWHSSFLDCPSHCVASYDNRLSEFLSWAQQLEMESNGKRRTDDGRRVDYPTAPIVWGGLGNDGQHTYYQLLREGTRRNAITLITVDDASRAFPDHALALARQAEAQAEALSSHDGGPAFNSVSQLRLRDLAPRSLGALMSAFEHATTVSAWLWGINPFDHPGVELGKKLAAQK
jgi:glucose-6-phosphate isomerase